MTGVSISTFKVPLSSIVIEIPWGIYITPAVLIMKILINSEFFIVNGGISVRLYNYVSSVLSCVL